MDVRNILRWTGIFFWALNFKYFILTSPHKISFLIKKKKRATCARAYRCNRTWDTWLTEGEIVSVGEWGFGWGEREQTGKILHQEFKALFYRQEETIGGFVHRLVLQIWVQCQWLTQHTRDWKQQEILQGLMREMLAALIQPFNFPQ